MTRRCLVFVLHALWCWGIFATRGGVTWSQLPPLGVAFPSPHLNGEVKALQVRDHGWVGPGHVHQEAPIAQQLLVGEWLVWVHQRRSPLLQDPPHLRPFLLGGQDAHSQLIHDMDYGAGPGPRGLAARANLSRCILDPKVTLLGRQHVTGLPSKLLARAHYPLVVHESEQITCSLPVLPPLHYPRVTRVIILRAWKI